MSPAAGGNVTARRQSRGRTRSVNGHLGDAGSDRQARRKALLANVGALGAGAAGVALASSIGVGELVAGGFVAYVAYRVIRYGVAWTEALIEGVELEHGEVPKKPSNVAA